MKQSNILTKLEQDLIQKLEKSTSLTVNLSNEVKSLNKELVSARKQLVTAKEELEVTKKQLPPQPQPLPAGFKASSATSQALATGKAQLRNAQKQLQEEINHHHSQVLQAISHRTSSALKEAAYQKALNSNYADATKAINARRNDINTNGVDVTVGYSGYSCKADFDPQSNQLFTFENLGSYEELEINRQSYSIIKSELSPISAGNLYHLQPVRHSNR